MIQLHIYFHQFQRSEVLSFVYILYINFESQTIISEAIINIDHRKLFFLAGECIYNGRLQTIINPMSSHPSVNNKVFHPLLSSSHDYLIILMVQL